MAKRTITFLIPFVAKYSENQWQDRCAKLQQSLQSILNSSNTNFEVVIAGHDKPDFLLQSQERVHFLSLDAPRPDPDRKDVIEARSDKLRKVAAAWNFAQANWDSDYVMKYDADDFISSKLVNWLATNEKCPGFRITRGWIWKEPWRHWIKQENKFDLSCGTSVIIASKNADLQIDVKSDNELIYEGLSSNTKFYNSENIAFRRTILVSNNHGNALSQFTSYGLKIQEIPFRAAIYRLGSKHSLSGDMHRISSIRMLISTLTRMRYLSKNIQNEFGMFVAV
jgi:hypothetical protein